MSSSKAYRDELARWQEAEAERNGGAWCVWFEDADRPPEVFTGEGAEEAARARYESARLSWACRLFREAGHDR